MVGAIRVKITGQVRRGESTSVELIRDLDPLQLGDSFQIGGDRVQIVSITEGFDSTPNNEPFEAQWTVAPMPEHTTGL
jgi:hypothetical protein